MHVKFSIRAVGEQVLIAILQFDAIIYTEQTTLPLMSVQNADDTPKYTLPAGSPQPTAGLVCVSGGLGWQAGF